MLGYSRPVLALVLVTVSLTAILITGCGTTGAYPSGTSGTPTSQLTTSPTALDFGNTTVGTASTRALSLTASSNASVVINQISSTGTAFTVSGVSLPLTLAAGASANLTVTANPQTAGSISETLSVISNASNSPTSIVLTTTASAPTSAVVSLNPTSLSFGSVTVGSSSAKSVVISNGGNANLTISQITSNGAGYTVSGFSLPIVLAAGASTSFNVTFTPTATGSASGSVALVSNASNSPATIAMTGSGAAASVAQLTASPSSSNFGNVTVGSSSTQSVSVTNSGNVSVTISQISTSGAVFSLAGVNVPLSLNPGQSSTYIAQFAPTAVGTASGQISFNSNASNSPTLISLGGTGVAAPTPQLTVNATSLSFGSVTVGSSGTKSITISNSGNANLTISQITTSGTGFSGSAITLPLMLTPGQTTNYSAQFAPTAAGTASGQILFSSNSPTNPPVSLAGTGVAAPVLQLSVSQSNLAFGNVTVGNNSSQSVVLTNSGNANVTISQITITGTGFSGSGITTPVTLTPGQTATYTTQFAPTAAGSASGQITFTSNASNSPTAVSLTGTGVAATVLQLTANPTSISFGNVNTGSTATQSVAITNTGNANVTISQITASGAAFSLSGVTVPLTLTPGQSSTYIAQFAPTTTGSASGQITFTSNASNSPTLISLTGAGVAAPTAQLSVNPASLSFGSVTVGNSGTQSITISNSGNANLTISQVTTSGAGFSGSGVTLPLTLIPGQTASYTAQFAPTAAGSATGQISFGSNSPTNPTVSLTGTGAAAPVLQLAASQSSLAFGNVTVGSTSSQSIVLTNTGNANVSISQITITGTGFSGSGITVPLMLTPGQNVSYTAQFAPTATGGASGQITFTSNASNSPTVVSLGGTGVAATVLQLTANPTSVNFGNVNTGSTATQSVAITNTGNANVTISQITPSGTGFNGSGVTVPMTLAAGQSVNYTAQFAPAATGSATGQISFISNATNSPTLVSLSGTGVTTTSGPLCGKLNDGLIHLPTNYDTFTPPAVGQSYVDPVFGCSVKRLTNGAAEALGDGTHPGLMHYYSTFTPINATDNLLMLVANNGSWHVRDLNGNIVVSYAGMPNVSGHPVWDDSNGNVFYYALNNALFSGTISGNSVTSTNLHTFSEYSAITSMDSADLSQDGDHIALVGQNASGTMDIFVWSFSQKTKTSLFTTACTGSVSGAVQPGCLHKLQLSADNRLTIQFNNDGSAAQQGVRLWTGSTLVHMQDATSHYDTGYDLNGNAIFTGRGNSFTLAGLTNPCPSGWGLDVRGIDNIQSAVCLLDNPPYWHISYRGSASQPWIAVSFFDSRTPGPEFFSSNGSYQTISSANWQLYEDEVVLGKVDGSKVYRLAHARSRSMESYWAQPHAAISRDGKYVIFTSNMAHPGGCPANMHVAGECSDVYVIQIQ